MIKIFTTNENKKIELTPEELKSLLDEAYWDGYHTASSYTYTYHTPSWTAKDITISCDGTTTVGDTISAKNI